MTIFCSNKLPKTDINLADKDKVYCNTETILKHQKCLNNWTAQESIFHISSIIEIHCFRLQATADRVHIKREFILKRSFRGLRPYQYTEIDTMTIQYAYFHLAVPDYVRSSLFPPVSGIPFYCCMLRPAAGPPC